MIPPTTNELKQHSTDLSDFAENLRGLNGLGKAFVNVAVVVVALIVTLPFLTPILA